MLQGDWLVICRDKHTYSIMASLFLPQWELYFGRNRQKVFAVVLKINPSSLKDLCDCELFDFIPLFCLSTLQQYQALITVESLKMLSYSHPQCK